MDARKQAIKAIGDRYKASVKYRDEAIERTRQLRRAYQAVRKLAGLKPLTR